MLRAIGAFVFLVFMTMVGLLVMQQVTPSHRAGVHSLVSLIMVLAVVWALVGGRGRKPRS